MRWLGWGVVLLGVALAILTPDVPMVDPTEAVRAGHAALAADDLGVALWQYERALMVAPRDTAAQLGAAVVRALRADILPDEVSGWRGAALWTADALSRAELAWVVWGVLAVWCGLLTTYLVRPARGLRRWARVVGGVLVVGCGVLTVRWVAEEAQPWAVVTAFEVRGHVAPDEGAPVLFVAYAAAEGWVLEERAGWVRFALADGREGWVWGESVRNLRF
jgi:hypothetical protein